MHALFRLSQLKVIIFFLAAAWLPTNCFATFVSSYQESTKNVMQLIEGEPSLSTLAKAIKAAGLDATLAEKGPYTIFAPNNAAFDKLPSKTLDNLLKPENKDELISMLKSHIVKQKIFAIRSGTLTSLNDTHIQVKTRGSAILVNDSNIVKANLIGTNGVIHIIDMVWTP